MQEIQTEKLLSPKVAVFFMVDVIATQIALLAETFTHTPSESISHWQLTAAPYPKFCPWLLRISPEMLQGASFLHGSRLQLCSG